MTSPPNMMTTPRTLWAAMLMSSIVMAGVAFVMRPSLPRGAEPPVVMFYTMVAAGVVVAIISFVIPAQSRRDLIRRARSHFEGLGGSNEITSAEDFNQPHSERDRLTAARRRAYVLFQTPFILSVALSEALSMFGLVLAFLGFSPLQFVPLLAVGTGLIAMRFPTEESVFAPIEQQLNVRLR